MGKITATLPLILVFYLGGFIQHQGILSPTQTNIAALIAMSFFFLNGRIFTPRGLLWITLAALILLAARGFYLQLPIESLTYLYYLICYLWSVLFGYSITRQYGIDFVARHAYKFIAIQVVVTSAQKLFLTTWLNSAKIPIGDIDAISGTMYIQSDATMVYVCVFLLILYTSHSSFMLRWLPLGIGCLIVSWNASSVTASVFCLLVVSLLIFNATVISRWRQVAIFSLLLASALLMTDEKIDTLYAETQALLDYLSHASASAMPGNAVSRFAPVGQLMFEPLSLLGAGPLTYYNPTSKEWLYNAGFSTFYSAYIDYGIIGLLVVIALLFTPIFSSFSTHWQWMLFVAGVFLFSMFNFSFSDIAFSITVGVLLGSRHIAAKA